MTDGLATWDDLKAAISAAGADPATLKNGPPAIASPSYSALESRSGVAGTAFAKVMHPEMRPWFDTDAACALAAQAGTAGIGPGVIWSDPATGAVVMDALTDGWRAASLADLQSPDTLAAAMGALRGLHATQAMVARFDPFARIDMTIAALRAGNHPLPNDIAWLRRLVGQIEPLMDDCTPLAPCRNDGSASNLMLHDDGRVRLIDFDRAGMNDPLYDVGVLLAEVTDFERDMAPGFAAYAGEVDAAAFARSRLWSMADDLMHGLWGRLMAFRSERKAVEWLKYGEWRLLRLRNVLRHPNFEEKLRLTGAL